MNPFRISRNPCSFHSYSKAETRAFAVAVVVGVSLVDFIVKKVVVVVAFIVEVAEGAFEKTVAGH